MPPLLPMLAALAAVSGVCLATGTPGARADHIVQPKEGKVSQNQLIDFNDAATVAPYRVEVLPNGDTWLVACFVPPNDACWSFKRFEETGDYVDVKVSPEQAVEILEQGPKRIRVATVVPHDCAEAFPLECEGNLRQVTDARQVPRPPGVEPLQEDFLLFCDAEQLREEGEDLAEALAIYQTIDRRHAGGPYAEPARLGAARCLLALGKVDEAERCLRAFHEADPDGLYRGEALLLLGRIALEERLDPAEAKMRFEQLDAWLARAREAVGEEALRPPPDAGRPKVRPGQLVNRETTWWYLHRLAEWCCLHRGFLHFVDGDLEAARRTYERVMTIPALARASDDPNDRYNDAQYNHYSRLMWGAKHGYLYAFPQELALFEDPRHRLGVLLCDFYYVTSQWKKTRALARKLLDDQYGRLSDPSREYAQYIYAAGVFRTEGNAKAIPEYLKVVEAGGGKLETFTQQRAAYAAANLARGPDRQLSRELFLRLIRHPRQTNQTYKARYVLAKDLILLEGQREEGLELLRGMPDDAGDYKALADHYLKKYVSQWAEEEKKQANQEEGKDAAHP